MEKISTVFITHGFFVGVMLLCLIGTHVAHANGFGVTLDKTVGNYIVNVDYDAISGIYAGSPVQFAFQLFNKDRSQQLDFSDVWVSITATSDKGKFTPPVFDGGVLGSTFPPSSISFTFPAAGSYSLALRYEKSGKTLAEATFPLDVLPGEGAGGQGIFQSSSGVIRAVAAALFVVLLLWIGRKILQRSKRDER